MIKKKIYLIFWLITAVAIISTLIAVVMTRGIPKPETSEVFMQFFIEDINKYMQTVIATLISTGSCLGVVICGGYIFVKYLKDEYHYTVNSDIMELDKRNLIAVGIIIGIAFVVLVSYIIRYLILLLIIPCVIFFGMKIFLEDK